MSTVFRRLQHYCLLNKLPILSQEVRYELGKTINHAFRQSEYSKILVFKIPSIEPEGVYDSISYPKKFKPVIDQIIADYYKEHSPPPKKERKRIPIKQSAYKKQFPKQKRRY